jgi:DNA-binding NarL/FixJ family response regulator
MHPEERYAIRSLKSGASGYISKDDDPILVIKAVRKIYDGRKYISPQISEKLINDLGSDSNKPMHEYLSDREFQVFILIAKGKSQTNIANELSLSVSTINTYRGRILDKLKLKTTSDLIHYGIENKLID